MSEVIPRGWSAHELEDLMLKIEGGGTPSRANPAFWNGSIPWATVKDLKSIRLSFTEESITESGVSASASRLVLANTPIIATRMAVGKIVVFDKTVAINQDLKAIYPSQRLDAEFFLHWYLANSEKIANLATGSTVKGIRLEILRALPLKLPPLPEQQEIATILSSVDNVIEKTRAQIDKLKELKTGMMQELLTQGIGHTEFKNSPVGTIPASWSVESLGAVAEFSSGGTPDRANPEYWNGEIPWVKTGEINYSEILKTEENITKKGLNESAAKIIPKGAILMAMYGQGVTRGRVAILGVDAAVNQACLAIISKGTVDVSFLYQLLIFRYEYLRSLVQEGAQKNLNSAIVKELLIPVPLLSEQLEIAKTLDSFDQAIAGKTKLLDTLTFTKKALMQDLLTGKVRVKVDSPETVAA